MVIGPHHRLFHRSTALLWARHLKCDSNDPPRRASGAGRRYHAGHFGLQRPPLAGAPLLHRLPGHSEDQGALGRGLQAPGGMKHLSKSTKGWTLGVPRASPSPFTPPLLTPTAAACHSPLCQVRPSPAGGGLLLLPSPPPPPDAEPAYVPVFCRSSPLPHPPTPQNEGERPSGRRRTAAGSMRMP